MKSRASILNSGVLLILGLLLSGCYRSVGSGTPTLQPLCTPPACAEGEIYHCPGNCPGGCGTICVTPTPIAETRQPLCTPPPCALGESYYCPENCPGGCGTICVTPTPISRGPVEIVYSQAGRLWSVTDEAEPRPLTTGDTDEVIRISPDGQRILFQRQLPSASFPGRAFTALLTVDRDGQGEETVLGPDALPKARGIPPEAAVEVEMDRVLVQAVWRPGTDMLAFTTADDFETGMTSPRNDLWLINLQNGALQELLPDGTGGQVAFSPDGNWLAVGTEKEVFLMRPDSTERGRVLPFESVLTHSEFAYMPMPVWAPDSSYVLVAIASREPFNPDASATFWKIPVEGDPIQLTTLPGNYLFPSMAPEGDRIWSSDRTLMAYVQNGTLYLARADGQSATLYDDGVLEFVAWVPGSNHFVYTRNQPTEFYLGAPGASPLRMILPGDATGVMEIQWIDAETFVYRALQGERQVLKMGSPGGPHPHRLITTFDTGVPFQFAVHP